MILFPTLFQQHLTPMAPTSLTFSSKDSLIAETDHEQTTPGLLEAAEGATGSPWFCFLSSPPSAVFRERVARVAL